jgi:hypothetical protein
VPHVHILNRVAQLFVLLLLLLVLFLLIFLLIFYKPGRGDGLTHGCCAEIGFNASAATSTAQEQ